jgi:hypothetical protein
MLRGPQNTPKIVASRANAARAKGLGENWPSAGRHNLAKCPRAARKKLMYFFLVRSGNGWPMLRFAIRRCG